MAIHDMRFSPCNQHIRIDYKHNGSFCYFCTVVMEDVATDTKENDIAVAAHTGSSAGAAIAGVNAGVSAADTAKGSEQTERGGLDDGDGRSDRCVVTVHCIPLSKDIETDLWETIKEGETLEDLINSLTMQEKHNILLSKLCGFIQV